MVSNPGATRGRHGRLFSILWDELSRHAPDASRQDDFAEFALPLQEWAAERSSERIAHPLQALHVFCSHEAVKVLQLLSGNRHWFFRLLLESLRVHCQRTDTHILFDDVLEAVKALQQPLPRSRLRVLRMGVRHVPLNQLDACINTGQVLLPPNGDRYDLIVNPLFAGDPHHPDAAAALRVMSAQL